MTAEILRWVRWYKRKSKIRNCICSADRRSALAWMKRQRPGIAPRPLFRFGCLDQNVSTMSVPIVNAPESLPPLYGLLPLSDESYRSSGRIMSAPGTFIASNEGL